jgi:CRISPR type III-A-associated protein Csm2
MKGEKMHKQNKNQSQNKKSNFNKDDLPKIDFNYENNPQLFGETAKKWAKKLESESSNQKNKSSQIRRFYDKVLELYEKSQNIEKDEEYKKQVYPFVVMLNSKAEYAKTRGKVSHTFVKMINSCVEQAKSKKEIETFKLFFEAVIGFYPKK